MTKPLKKPLNYDEQLDNLINNHALVIDDREKAIQILKQVSYYRLSAYGIGLKRIENQEQYCEGISIDHLYRIYRFDSQLRNLLRSTCEYLEICLRSVISYHLAISYGADGFMNSNNFTDKRRKYEEDQRGSTSGSSVASFRQRDGLTIYLHKPHPPILKAYQIRAIRQKLKENGDIDE